jgi:hypothetical protein
MPEETLFYTNEAAMEPLMPTDPSGELRESAARLLVASAKVAGALHPLTRKRVAELVRHMNSYYSNLIEGHHTHPVEIERALKKDYSSEPAKRALQLESAAHIEVETLMLGLLSQVEEPVCADNFIQMLHREFYLRMPEEFRVVESSGKPIVPGEYRQGQVAVGEHVAPAFTALPRFMERLQPRMIPANLIRLSASSRRRPPTTGSRGFIRFKTGMGASSASSHTLTSRKRASKQAAFGGFRGAWRVASATTVRCWRGPTFPGRATGTAGAISRTASWSGSAVSSSARLWIRWSS